MITTYRETCPQRTVQAVQQTIATWLSVSLSCGHKQVVNWTPRVGSVIGCTDCAEQLRAVSPIDQQIIQGLTCMGHIRISTSECREYYAAHLRQRLLRELPADGTSAGMTQVEAIKRRINFRLTAEDDLEPWAVY
jgi:hypothetical protein